MCGSRKYPYSSLPPPPPPPHPPHRRDWKFLGGGGWGSQTPKNLKQCMGAKLEFPERWEGGLTGQIPSVVEGGEGGERHGYFLEPNNNIMCCKLLCTSNHVNFYFSIFLVAGCLRICFSYVCLVNNKLEYSYQDMLHC